MNRNTMPLVLMLVAGAATCVITFIKSFSMNERLSLLLIVLIVFYLLGCALKWTLNYFDRQNEEESMEAGEVFEKDAEGDVSAENPGEPREPEGSESES